ncbi:hypothetical protein IE81DRAFT_121980 [Ceraceosorus guamensis]|uniref:Uncharacterized protein n=1 Tax=Ceraceosorus guamensis TaxID=1522189 RepID=A0A316W208_9BASI|nr:hypothetical protein IE81DRAFT_121980 [Ceraceosorus guamensis]PWN42591.1 hypothetical protein IE81DRAFT_121980 [Ceraceosorus guamensis]
MVTTGLSGAGVGQALLQAARAARPRLLAGTQVGPPTCPHCCSTARPYSTTLSLSLGDCGARSEPSTLTRRTALTFSFLGQTSSARSQSNTALHPRGVDSSLFEDEEGAEYVSVKAAEHVSVGESSSAALIVDTASRSHAETGPTRLVVQRIQHGDVPAATQLVRELSELGTQLDPSPAYATAARYCMEEKQIDDTLLWLRLLGVPGAATAQVSASSETAEAKDAGSRVYQSDADLAAVALGLRAQFAARSLTLGDLSEALRLIVRGGFLAGAAYPSIKRAYLTILRSHHPGTDAAARNSYLEYFEELARAHAMACGQADTSAMSPQLTDLFNAGTIAHVKAGRPEEALKWLLAALSRSQENADEVSISEAVVKVVVSALMRQEATSAPALTPQHTSWDAKEYLFNEKELPESVHGILMQLEKLGDDGVLLSAAVQAIQEPPIAELELMSDRSVQERYATLLNSLARARQDRNLSRSVRIPSVRYLLALSNRLDVAQNRALDIAIGKIDEGAKVWQTALLARALRDCRYQDANAIWQQHFMDVYGVSEDVRTLVFGSARPDRRTAGSDLSNKAWPSRRSASLMLRTFAAACGGDASKLEQLYSMWLEAAFADPSPSASAKQGAAELDTEQASLAPDAHNMVQIAEPWIEAAAPSQRTPIALRVLNDFKRLEVEPDANVWAVVFYALGTAPNKLDTVRLGTIADGMAMFRHSERADRKVPGLGAPSGSSRLMLPAADLKSYLVLVDVLTDRNSTRLASTICASMFGAAIKNHGKQREASVAALREDKRRMLDRVARRAEFARTAAASDTPPLQRYRHYSFSDFRPIDLKRSAPLRALLRRLRRARMDAMDSMYAKSRARLVQRHYEERAPYVYRPYVRANALVDARYAYLAEGLRRRDEDLLHMDEEEAALEWCKRELEVYSVGHEAKLSEDELLAMPRRDLRRKKKPRAAAPAETVVSPAWPKFDFGLPFGFDTPAVSHRYKPCKAADAHRSTTGGIHDAIYDATFETR